MESLAAAASLGGAQPLQFCTQIHKSHPCPPPPFFPTHHRRKESSGAGYRHWFSSSHGPITAAAVAAASNPTQADAPPGSPSPGLYSATVYDLTAENVNLVLEDVRPYLIADGGNVDVVSVEEGIVSLKLQGACGSCPSSTTTMKMWIKRVLKEKFGEAVKDVRQVSDELEIGTTVEAVNSHLDILRSAIKNFGGSAEVVSVEGGDCHVRYVGPDSIGTGVKAAIKEKFPDIVNVVLTG